MTSQNGYSHILSLLAVVLGSVKCIVAAHGHFQKWPSLSLPCLLVGYTQFSLARQSVPTSALLLLCNCQGQQHEVRGRHQRLGVVTVSATRWSACLADFCWLAKSLPCIPIYQLSPSSRVCHT